MTNFAEFLDYVLSFYGKDGIYPDNKRTKEQIAYATLMHLDMCASEHVTDYTWGNGDSLDRERVRDQVIETRSHNQAFEDLMIREGLYK